MFSGRIFMLAVLCSTAGSGYAGERWSQGFDPDSWTVTEQGARGILGNPNSALLHRQAFMPVEDSLNMRLAGFYGIGPGGRISLQGDNLFLTAHFGFVVYDIGEDPAKPHLVAGVSNEPVAVMDISANGNYLYAFSSGLGIMTYDITDPTTPLLLSRTDFLPPGVTKVYPAGLVTEKGLFALLENYPTSTKCCSLKVYSLANPAEPEFVSAIGLSSRFAASDVRWLNRLDSNRVLATASSGVLYEVDVSNMAAPQISGCFELPENLGIYGPVVYDEDKKILYAVPGDHFANSTWFYSYDATDISSLKALDSFNMAMSRFAGTFTQKIGKDTLVSLSILESGNTYFIDVSDPEDLKILAVYNSLPQASCIRNGIAKDGFLYTADVNKGIRTLDVSNINDAKEVASHIPGIPNFTSSSTPENGELFACAFWPTLANPLVRFKVSGTGELATNENYRYYCSTSQVDVATRQDLLVLSSQAGLQFFKNNEHSLELLSTLDLLPYNMDYPGRLWIDGNKLFAACGIYAMGSTSFPGDIGLVNITDPKKPLIMRTKALPGTCNSLAERNGIIYVTGFYSDSASLGYLGIYRLVGEDIALVSTTDLETPGLGISLQGSKLYLSRIDAMDVYDVSNPGSPELLGTTTVMLEDVNDDIVASGDRAYVASDYELLAFDVSNPLSPGLVGYYKVSRGNEWYGLRQRLHSDGNFLYWSTVGYGLCVIDPYGDAEMVAEPALDNPSLLPLGLDVSRGFGHEYMIRYSLPAPADVNISVYDASGRRLKVLRASRETAGTHLFTWNAGGVSSGVYFVRLTTSAGSATAKLLVLD